MDRNRNTQPGTDAVASVTGAVRAALHGRGAPVDPPPLVPDVWLAPADLARLFGKNKQTPKRWKRWRWIEPRVGSAGHQLRYDAIAVVSLATRLFIHFRRATYVAQEADRWGLKPLLDWVAQTVRRSPEGSEFPAPAVLDFITLASLAEEAALLPAEWGVTASQLRDQESEARRQLRIRLRDPHARMILSRAWRNAGIAAATHQAESGFLSASAHDAA